MRLEPGRKNLRIEAYLSRDVESQFNNPSFGIMAEADAIGACDTNKEVCQAGREMVVLNECLLFTLHKRCKEQHGLFDNPLIERAGGNLCNGDVNLFSGSKRDAWMGEWTARLIAEKTRKLLKANLDVFCGLVVLG